MHRTLLGTLLAIALLALPVAALPVAAHGERWTGEDAVGDARASQWDVRDWCTDTDVSSEAAPGEDITALGVRHGRRRVVLRLDYAAPSVVDERRRTFSLHVRTPRHALVADVFRAGGQWRVRVGPEIELEPVDHPDAEPGEACQIWVGSGTARSCRQREVEIAARSVTVTLPRTCLGSPAWVEVGADSQAHLPDQVIVGDTWGTSEPSENPNVITYGERVAARAPQKGSPSNRSRVTNSATSWRRSLVISRTGLPIGTTAATAY